MLEGFKLNVKIFMIAEPIILIVGLLLAVIRSGRNPVFFPARAAVVAYIDIFRGAPSLLVILTLGFGVPALRIAGVPNTAVFWGTVACILTSSAYQAEVFRAGIESVHASQRAAARSLGLSGAQAMRFVVLPQAVRRVIPPTLSGFVALQKETALISVLGPLEATRQAQIYASLNFNFTSYLAAGLHLHRGDDPAGALHRLPARPHGGAPDDRGRGVSGPLLQVDGLYKAYDQHLVLRNINLAVEPHEVISLIGASGCGKSTLLRCVNLLEEINAGSIRLNGEPISTSLPNANRVRQRIGLVFQSYNLFPHMSVLDNITLAPRKVLGAKRAEAEGEARALLERFGLADKAGEYPDRLSGGQQQRVAIVRALALKPDLLLLDEVTSALDPEMVGEVLDIIRELKEHRDDDDAGNAPDGLRAPDLGPRGVPGRGKHRGDGSAGPAPAQP